MKYVSLFSGAGGLDIGLERAGLEAASLCELETVFCRTLEANAGWEHSDGRSYFKSAQIVNADIREVSARDLFVGSSLDLLVGGPPCQAFSSSGKQLSVLDPRGALVSEFYRLVDELKPRMFLFENVRGLVTARDRRGEPGGVILELIRILESSGYSCRAALLNSADFGSYQRRVRCFIVGSRRGSAPVYPTPEFQKNAGLFGKEWRSLGEFLEEHAEIDRSEFVYPSADLARMLSGIPSGSGLKSPGKAEATRPSGHWGYRQGTFIADLSLPARTVTGSASQDWIRWKGELRRLSFREVKLLQGFTDDWEFRGTKAQRYKQVGNAVPTMFGEVLGQMIVSHLKNFPRSQPKPIPLPESFHGYMEYTRRDHARNHEARVAHRAFQESD
jgi:DNA (cytosine-5)-methyltransferase 1